MVVYRRTRFSALTAIACGLLAGCGSGDPAAPTPWSYPVELTPSPLAPFWSEGPGDFEGYRFAFDTDQALDPADTDGSTDIYIYDAETGGLTFFEPEPMIDDGYFSIFDPVVSEDGRYVTWLAGMAGNMYSDAETAMQVYVRDIETGATTQASVSSEGAPGEGPSYSFSLSADGRFVAFTSFAANLVPNDLNGGGYSDDQDVFVHDLLTRETERIDILPDGEIANAVRVAAMSGDGGVVVFGAWNLYLRDLESQETLAIGLEGDLNEIGLDYNLTIVLSYDGSVIAYPVRANEATSEGAEETVSRSYIWVASTDPVEGSSPVVLGPFEYASWGIELSADGRYIAYAVTPAALDDEEPDGPIQLLVTDLVSGVTQEIAVEQEWADREGTRVRVLGLSPDGRYLVYDALLFGPIVDLHSRDPLESHLYVHDLVTGDTTRLY